ncbi:MAG: alpha/beta hydrolase fold domain-containing protein [Acidimicrobiia bacterium]
MLGGALTEGVRVAAADLGGVGCVVAEPAAPHANIVWFHGGGYRLGSADGSKVFASRLASITSARVVMVDYRLAPEHPYPAAVVDASRVYDAVLADPAWNEVPTLAAGDSAGGGLALALAVAARDAGAPVPAGLVLLSPWADLRNGAESYTTNAATDPLFSLASATEAAGQYLQGHDPADPYVSPVLAEATGLPPALVFASTDETLRDDALAVTRLLAEARIAVELHLVPDTQHVWPTIFPDHPATLPALEDIATFVGRLAN